MVRGFGVGLSGRDRQPRPDRAAQCSGFLELAGTDPAVLDRRVDVGRLWSRAADASEAKRGVVGHLDGARFLPELRECCVAEREARLIEGVEVLEDQQRHRLAEIERRLSDRAEQSRRHKSQEPACRFERRRRQSPPPKASVAPVSAREVEAGVDMGRVRHPKQHGVRRFRRPTRQVRGAKIGRVELGPRDLGDAVDAADACRGRVPLLPSRQRLARGKVRAPRRSPGATRLRAQCRSPSPT